MSELNYPISTVVYEQLDSTYISKISTLLNQVTEFDGVRPLSEHAWLHLKKNDGGKHVVGFIGATLAGYAHVDITDLVEGTSAELAVSPEHRNLGVGHALVNKATQLSPDGRLRLWAHGLTAGAQSLADSLDFRLSRSLWQMRRSLFAPLPLANVPEGVRIRSFDPATDIPGILAVNARAFAELPDQGGWTENDIAVRLAEPWFVAAGFFVALDSSTGAIIGFHWTKVHGSGHDHGHEAIGEVYVLAVDPQAQIRGLGRALTIIGLTHLRGLGLRAAMLYVDSSNERAISLYESLGFVHWDTDVMYRRPV
ncbi:MAG: mycothiol synthase [Actinomycetia bacterium]|nr:mycothiol synthase [Actinomycetes bacterium]